MFNSTPKANTPYISWTEDLTIGHEVIDADHQNIFDTLNRLQEEILGEEPEYSIVGEVLIELIEHTGGHFMREEALMQAIQFPWYEEHRLEHKVLMEKVNALHRRFMDGRKNLSGEVSEYLQKALIPHILYSDMKLGECMRAARQDR